jgi:hypothetical protein
LTNVVFMSENLQNTKETDMDKTQKFVHGNHGITNS